MSNRFQTQFQAPGSSKSWSLAILIAKHLCFHVSLMEASPLNHYLFVQGLMSNIHVTLAATYAPMT